MRIVSVYGIKDCYVARQIQTIGTDSQIFSDFRVGFGEKDALIKNVETNFVDALDDYQRTSES